MKSRQNMVLTVAVEPLDFRRTNFLNSMEEMRDFLPFVQAENITSGISLRELDKI